MGFFGNILSGGAGIAGANNAHLAELTIRHLNQSEKQRVAARVADITRYSGFPNMSDDQVFDMFNNHERLSQLNLLALAFNEMGISPPVNGESWMPVRNPLMLSTDSSDLQANAGHFRRKHGLTLSVGTTRIDIKQWSKP
jgi:hypothetical protein